MNNSISQISAFVSVIFRSLFSIYVTFHTSLHPVKLNGLDGATHSLLHDWTHGWPFAILVQRWTNGRSVEWDKSSGWSSAASMSFCTFGLSFCRNRIYLQEIGTHYKKNVRRCTWSKSCQLLFSSAPQRVSTHLESRINKSRRYCAVRIA